MGNKTYQIRKTILKALEEYGSAPCSVDDVLGHPSFGLIRPEVSEVQEQWNKLEGFGFIAAVDGFDGKYCKITEKGLQQLNPEFKKDPFIWGPHFQ
jgi:hypothetical protein